ncbi:MAG: NAD-dependent epimerase/dehydratase family protein [Acidimicrobiales bacterium]
MRVLVTGGSGFVGSHVVDALVDAGHGVRVLDRAAPAFPNEGAEYRLVDVRRRPAWDGALDGVDAVCHQAARVGLGVDMSDVADYVSDNDAGTAELLHALHRARCRGRLVLASSMVVYGEGLSVCAVHGPVRAAPRTPADLDAGMFEPRCPSCAEPLAPGEVDEDTPSDPRNVYAATKLHQEHLCAAWGREADAPVTALRYHNVYGPRMPADTPYAGVASIFRSALAAGRPPQVFEDGGQRRDFVHVTDVARANVLALTAERPVPGAFNVASGHVHTVGDLAAALAAAANPDGRPVDPVITGRWRLGDVRHVVASARRAREVLGFEAAVPFAAGVAALTAKAE